MTTESDFTFTHATILAKLFQKANITLKPDPTLTPSDPTLRLREVGKVWINKEQYFAGVPKIVWEFYIGGYQLAQKWLKDRKGRILRCEDILHYQKIVVALSETDRLIEEINS